MPLETGTYVSDLTTTNPPGTDQRKQGDDHLRLIKSVLKTTFPNASKAFYFPDYAAKTTTYTILSTEQNKYFGCATAGGAWTITLPALVAGDAGWSTIIFKTDTSQNGLTITPSAGTINGETSLRLSQIYDAIRVLWSGTAWTAIPVKSALRIRSITADITVAEADLDSLILCTPAANTTITLPAVANYIGRMLAVTHIPSGAFTTTLDGNAAETVNGAATFAMLTTRNTIILIATTTGWEVVSDTAAPAGVPTGTIHVYAGLTAPTDYLFCYGQAISRTTYAALFAVVSTTYGVGDGSTTFNLPDLRGRAVAGKDNMGGVSADRLTGLSGGVDGDILGAVGGSQQHFLSIAEIPAHTHTYDRDGTSTGFGGANVNDGTSSPTGSTGGGGAHNNVQPTFILNYIIRI